MSCVKLKLEYDGTDFVGWQFQLNGRSIQEEVEKALKQILRVDIRVVGGGRTDAGVHAHGQVASFESERDIEIQSLATRLNGVLPHTIVVKEALFAPFDFHARHSAKERRYRYYIHQGQTAIERKYCWQIFNPLDIPVMQKCAQQLLGTHDFRSFCKVHAEVQNYHCVVSFAAWSQSDSMVMFDITSNRFLHGMVRTLVGTMVNIGRGHTEFHDFKDIFEASDRSVAGMSAPAKGLFLEEIIY